MFVFCRRESEFLIFFLGSRRSQESVLPDFKKSLVTLTEMYLKCKYL